MHVFADLVWWFAIQPSELWAMTVLELNEWTAQMNRQIKAKYSKFF